MDFMHSLRDGGKAYNKWWVSFNLGNTCRFAEKGIKPVIVFDTYISEFPAPAVHFFLPFLLRKFN